MRELAGITSPRRLKTRDDGADWTPAHGRLSTSVARVQNPRHGQSGSNLNGCRPATPGPSRTSTPARTAVALMLTPGGGDMHNPRALVAKQSYSEQKLVPPLCAAVH